MAGKAGRPSKKTAGTAVDAKQQIIDAAVMLIKRDGADQLTVRKVVEASGLSIGTFYHHFKDKDDLLMDFVKESSFSDTVLTAPISEPAARVCEKLLYHREPGSVCLHGNRRRSICAGHSHGPLREGTYFRKGRRISFS